MEGLRAQDPARIGEFTLLARLGAGGMGRVYLGRSPGGIQVAIKVIREDIAEYPEALTRFGREVETVRAVRSVYTANLVDASLQAPPYWLATEFVPGPTLLAATRGVPLPPALTTRLFAALAEGLAVVHQHGVIHRDLKPHNIILAPNGPRLIDFGIARAAEHTQLTSTGQAPGTPGYTAPEVLLGEEVTAAADVFALGATMAAAATGRAPYGAGEWAVVSYRVVHGEIDVAGVEPGLAALIRACVAREPGRRPGLREVIARCGVGSALASEPAYQALASSGEPAPADLPTAMAAGLVPPGHGMQGMHAMPTASPGWGPQAASPMPPQPVVPHTPTTMDGGGTRLGGSRRRLGLVVGSAMAVAVVATVVTQWLLPGDVDGDGAVDPGASGGSSSGANGGLGETEGSEGTDETSDEVTDGATDEATDAGLIGGSDGGETGEPPRLRQEFYAYDVWQPDRGYCSLPAAERLENLQYSVDTESVPGSVEIGWRLKFDPGTLEAPYYIAAAVRPPITPDNTGSGGFSLVYTTESFDLLAGDPTQFTYVTYPDDFRDSIPLEEMSGDWTVIFYHVQSPNEAGSVACYGFTTP